MTQQLMILDKSDSLSWALMPLAVERIKTFCHFYQTDTNAEALANLVHLHFVADQPLMKVAVGFQKGRGVFAHLLACIDENVGNRFLTIMQVEADVPFEDRDAVNDIYKQLEAWAVSHGAIEANIVTLDTAHVKLFERFYGFKQHRIVMRKPLEK